MSIIRVMGSDHGRGVLDLYRRSIALVRETADFGTGMLQRIYTRTASPSSAVPVPPDYRASGGILQFWIECKSI